MMPPTTAAPCYFTYPTRLRAGEARGSARRRLRTAKHSVTRPSARAAPHARCCLVLSVECDEDCECDGRAPTVSPRAARDGAPCRLTAASDDGGSRPAGGASHGAGQGGMWSERVVRDSRGQFCLLSVNSQSQPSFCFLGVCLHCKALWQRCGLTPAGLGCAPCPPRCAPFSPPELCCSARS